jgi:hypothetical protein
MATTDARTELPVVQSGNSCCSTIPTQSDALTDDARLIAPEESSCCSSKG